jgi:sortase A
MARYKTFDRRRRGAARRIVSVLALLLVLGGLGLVGYTLLAEDSPVSRVVNPPEEPPAPADTTLQLTVPALSRVENLTVRTAPATDEAALEAGGLHVEGTGYPWEGEANVYIAGHRLGYPGTDSYLVFWDLDKLRNGDEVILTDADGTRYTYSVFTNFVVGPYDFQVTEPVPGKNIVSLQTCTLPDYSERLIVQAELVSVA